MPTLPTLFMLFATANCIGSQNVVASEQVKRVKELHKAGKEACLSISSEHKDIHASISKFGRAIDKVCSS